MVFLLNAGSQKNFLINKIKKLKQGSFVVLGVEHMTISSATESLNH